MAFVHVPQRRPAIEPTAEEAALLRELAGKGLAGDDLAAALSARGVAPDRALLLAGLVAPRSAAGRVVNLAAASFWIVVAIVFGAGKRPLHHWLREHYPGSEWLVELILPAVIGLAVLWTLMSRLRKAGDAPEGTTRADQIENKPIG
jgi:hypothetical protein